MTSGRGFLVIWNPDAGEGRERDLEERRAEIERVLADRGIEAEIFVSSSEGSAERRIDDALGEDLTAIVAAGGDATVRSVAARLIDRQTPLGILPMGTAMNIAQDLGIPLDIRAAAGILSLGHVRSIDVGEARGHAFLGIASIGLEAEILAAATHAQAGRLRGALAVLRRAWRYPRTRVRLQLDGREVRTRAVSVAVANGRFTGRRLELVPSASLDDGRFEVLLFGGAQLASRVIRAFLRRPPEPRIRRYRAATVRVSSHRPLPVRADSVDLGQTPIELVTRQRSVRVIAPRGSL
jgi:diacylglycerol kinase (ATP)